MPDGVMLGCGFGCGTRDFPRANCLRAFLLDTAEASGGPNDPGVELKANIDDMTGVLRRNVPPSPSSRSTDTSIAYLPQ